MPSAKPKQLDFDALCQKALAPALTEDAYWEIVTTLRGIAQPEHLAAVFSLARGSRVAERELGANLLAQFGGKNRICRAQCRNELLRMLQAEASGSVLGSIIAGLGHQEATHRGGERLLALTDSRDKQVRTAIAFALNAQSTPLLDKITMKLMHDPAMSVRNLATFSLAHGPLKRLKEPRCRKALLERLGDRYRDVQSEAVIGCARLGDARGILVATRLLDSGWVDLVLLDYLGQYRSSPPLLESLVRQERRLAQMGGEISQSYMDTLRATIARMSAKRGR